MEKGKRTTTRQMKSPHPCGGEGQIMNSSFDAHKPDYTARTVRVSERHHTQKRFGHARAHSTAARLKLHKRQPPLHI